MLGVVLSLALGPPQLPDGPAVPNPDPVPPTVVTGRDPTPPSPDTAGVPMTQADAVAAAVDLTWSAPDACPEAQEVRSGIAGLLGKATDPVAAAEVHVIASVTEPGSSYRLNLRIETPSGRTT